MHRILLSLFAFLFLSHAHAQGVDETAIDRIKRTHAVNIGFRPAATPFSFLVPTSSTPIGYSIEICVKVVEELKKALKLPDLTVKYIPVDHKARFPYLEDGRIDMECANSSITVDRRKRGFSFSIPYFITGTKILARSDMGAKHIRDLAGKTIILADKTIAADIVKSRDRENGLALKFLYMKSRAEGLQWMEQDKADALVEDVTNLWGQRANSKNPQKYEIIGDYLGIEPMAIMFGKGSDELKAAADQALRKLMQSGEIFRLHHRWFESPVPPNQVSMDMPMGPLMKDMVKYPTDQVTAFP